MAFGGRVRVVHQLPQRLRLQVYWLRGQDGLQARTLLASLAGVTGVRVNPVVGCVVVAYDGSNTTRQAVLQAMGALPGLLPAEGGRSVAQPVTSLPVWGGALLLFARLLPPPWRLALTWWRIAPSLVTGLRSLVRHGLTVEAMDAAAIGLSAWRGDHAAALTTRLLVDVGEHLQYQVERRADDSLHRLLPRLPATVWLEVDGQWLQRPADQVQLDDRVVVGMGDMVPVDGEVVAGVARVNESSLTGEPLPVRKEPGKQAISGSVVEEGRITIRAVRVGERTALARIARFIAYAAEVPSRHQRLAERLARQRVRWTFGMAGLTWLLTRDARRAASALLVDFSCGIRISTPVAFKAAMIRAGREGVLIKGGEALEHLALADTVVFDKTGTLTSGDLAIERVISCHPGCPEDHLLAVVSSLEEHAPHPLAEAVVREGNRRQLHHVSHGEVAIIVAHGLHAVVDGRLMQVGSRHYLEEDEGISFAGQQSLLAELEEAGLIPLLVSRDREAAGIIALRDCPRPEAARVVAGLRQLGVKHMVMLSGDRQAKAQAAGQALGMDQVFGELIPEQKAQVVEGLKQQGRRVIFVGDGINDAPALAVADVGVAMPRGAELARDTADVVLLHDHLAGVVAARAVAMRALAVVRGNFAAAVSLNAAILAGASLGWLSPVVTSVLHNSASLGVLARSWSLHHGSLVQKGLSWND